MTSSPVPNPAQVNRASLSEETLAVIGPFVSIVGYVCLVLLQNTGFGQRLPAAASFGAIGLIALGILAFLLRKSRQTLAMWLLVWGSFFACVMAIVLFSAPSALYLLAAPVILATSLLRRRLTMGVALCALVFTVVIAPLLLPLATPLEIIMPAVVMSVVTLTALIASRNLQITLEWLSWAYDAAMKNEKLVRDQSMELKRAFKALDEATVRLDRLNVSLAHERNEADKARRIKQQFAQTISHELRTPLNLVVAFTDLMTHSPELYGAPLPPAYLRDLTVVQRNALHLQSLVNDVLELSQIESAQIGLVLEQASPEQMVLDAANMMRSLIEAHGLSLTVQVEAGLPTVWVDITRIRQVLINFINNAVKFTERGGIVVAARLSAAGDAVVFSVRDTGMGIAEKDVPHLFEEFSQLDSGTRRKHGGTGLGLAISKRFVQLHHGEIGVESTLGEGSTFYFALPANRNALDAQLPAPANLQRLPYSGDRIVLVITQSPFAASVLSRHLREWHIVTSSDLCEAGTLARQLMPQLVVLDTTRSPHTFEALQAFLTECQLKQTLGICCPLPGEDLMRRQIGAQQYLVKPVSRESVLEAVEHAAGQARRVLVIDDDEDFVRLMRRFLDSAGRNYRVTGAYSGEEGLALLQQVHPDLVVLDMQLPDISGVEVAQRIHALPEYAGLPIIVISAQDVTPALDAVAPTIVMGKSEGMSASELVSMIARIAESDEVPAGESVMQLDKLPAP